MARTKKTARMSNFTYIRDKNVPRRLSIVKV